MSDAVVVGAGFAGLSAAVALADAGVRVRVIEARPTAGGRANTFRDPLTGERVDNGQHILAGCYHATLAFLRRLDTHTLLHRPSTLSVSMIDERGWHTTLTCPALPSPLNLLAGVLAWEALTAADRVAMLRIGAALRGSPPPAPGETVRQWLHRHHQSPRLCRLFWEPLALAALNQSIEIASAEMFVAVTSRMFGDDPDAATILVPAVPLDALYVLPSLALLQDAGARVTLQSKAQLRVEHDRVVGAVAGSDTINTPVVISAVPWFSLRGLFPSVPAALERLTDDAAALGSAPIVTVDLWFERWHSPQPMIGLPGRHFQWLFDRRHYVGAAQRHVSLISSGAETICDRANDSLIQLALAELRTAFPDVPAVAQHATVIRERRATFSLAPVSPPRPAVVTPVGGFFLAGDWIDTGLPATIESAVVSGQAAAQAALEYLGGR